MIKSKLGSVKTKNDLSTHTNIFLWKQCMISAANAAWREVLSIPEPISHYPQHERMNIFLIKKKDTETIVTQI